MISRMASAPIERASKTCQGWIMKSLRSTGRVQAARAVSRSSRRALEIRPVGQDRQAGGTAFLIGRGQRRRVERVADQPAGGRGALDLGDQPGAAFADAGAQRAHEVARLRRMGGGALDLGQRRRGHALGAPPSSLSARMRTSTSGTELASVGGLRSRARSCCGVLGGASGAEAGEYAKGSAVVYGLCGDCRTFAQVRGAVRPRSARRRHSAAPCLDMGPATPFNNASSAAAFCAGSPPRSAAAGARGRPASSGVTVNSRTSVGARGHDLALAGQRQLVEALAMDQPGALGAEPAQRLRHRAQPFRRRRRRSSAASPAPGLASGPSRLKMVRVPSSTRGPAAWRIEAWWRGAIRKTMPASASTAGSRSIGTSSVMPSAASASAAPDLRRQRPVAVLGDRHAAARHHHRRGGRDVERARPNRRRCRRCPSRRPAPRSPPCGRAWRAPRRSSPPPSRRARASPSAARRSAPASPRRAMMMPKASSASDLRQPLAIGEAGRGSV